MRISMGEELTEENDTNVKWREYFAQLLNDEEIIKVGVWRARFEQN